MAIVTVEKNSYTVDSLYQWDKNQELVIYGLSLATIPEIHFTTDAMDKAIVRQSTMDDAGVIRAEIPNSLLQKPNTIKAYVCVYEGDTFESLYSIIIPVKTRKKPCNYTIEDTDGEIYSFNALENLVINTVNNITVENAELEKRLTDKYDQTANELIEEYGKVNADVEKTLDEIEEFKTDIENQVTEIETNGLKRADVVDNLLSESTDLPLSAYQGKVLDNKVSELNSKTLMIDDNSRSSDFIAIQEGTVIDFVSTRKMLFAYISCGMSTYKTEFISNVSGINNITSITWSTTTICRVTYEVTDAGIKINSVFKTGDWANYNVYMMVCEL